MRGISSVSTLLACLSCTNLLNTGVEKIYIMALSANNVTCVGFPRKSIMFSTWLTLFFNTYLVFQFDDHVFTQICGIAIRTKFTPDLATIYIGDLEEAFIGERDKKPDLWVCYIDDIFMLWSHTRKELDAFLLEPNRRCYRWNDQIA